MKTNKIKEKEMVSVLETLFENKSALNENEYLSILKNNQYEMKASLLHLIEMFGDFTVYDLDRVCHKFKLKTQKKGFFSKIKKKK